MARLHLFEFLDQRWLPATLRQGATAYLNAAYEVTPLPRLWAGMLYRALAESGETRIVDLGSGSGGPLAAVARHLENRPEITLTDLYPGSVPGFRYWPHPVRAEDVPEELAGLRTMFASFHHLRPEQARAVLASAARQRAPLMVCEATSRSPAALLTALLIPLAVLVLTPRIRPLRAAQLGLTYLIPILPLIIAWDGFVSHLRTYSAAELHQLTAACEGPGYRWEVEELSVAGVPFRVTVLRGIPVARTGVG